jgi:hypothetical protein
MQTQYNIDPYLYPEGTLRDHWQVINDLLSENPFLRLFGKRYELVFAAASTNYRLTHGLGFTPTDVIMTYISPDSGVTATFNYDEFSNTEMDITVSGACTIRFIAGRYY